MAEKLDNLLLFTASLVTIICLSVTIGYFMGHEDGYDLGKKIGHVEEASNYPAKKSCEFNKGKF